MLLENVDGEHFTIEEYKEKVQIAQVDKNDTTVILSNNTDEHDAYISSAKEMGYDVLKLDTLIIMILFRP